MKKRVTKVLQIMPVKDIYIRDKGQDGAYFYDRAIALALTEFYINGEAYQGIRYLSRFDLEILDPDLAQQPQDIFFYDEICHLLTKENSQIDEIS